MMTFFVGTIIDMSPTPSKLDFAASLGALRAVVGVLTHDIINHANRGARGQGALIDVRMRLFVTASKSLPLRWGRCAPW